MTPFKQNLVGRRYSEHQSTDDMDAESESLESPPSHERQRLSRNRLFGVHPEDDSGCFSFNSFQPDDVKNTTRNRTPMRAHDDLKQKILKPVDLNLSFGDEDDETQGELNGSKQYGHMRKRLQKFAESARRESHTPTRAYSCTSSDSDSAMISSPYVSPSTYMTMDGRCVTSKNPFSPMITDETLMAGSHQVTMVTTGSAPSFPISFDNDSASCAPPLARHRLQKRDMASPSKRSLLYASFTRDGYPERCGRYSFTGSPIKEHGDSAALSVSKNGMDISTSASPSTMAAATKVRRLRLNDDVHYPGSGARRPMRVDTSESMVRGGASSVSSFEEVSPTDVLSFPAPPTPTKSKKSLSPYPSVSNPPETPFISRSGRRPRRRIAGLGAYGIYQSAQVYQNFSSDSDSTGPPAATTSRFKSDFDVIGELGSGSFGNVWKVLSKLDGCMYAIKTALRKVKGNADRDRMLKEVYALAALSDQADPATFHIVRYHQAWMEDDRLFIQTELCSSTLADEIQASGGRLSPERRYKLLREILLALEFIHREENGMCHLDIKPENIFVKNVFKLGDFGLVTKISYHKDVEEGDSRYMSMELLSGDHRDLTKSDIFSLGATLYETCLGRSLPMNGPEWQAIRAGSLEALDDTPYEMDMIIREMMNPTFKNRPSAADLLKREQLLSKEQKQLILERNKVFQAKLALAQQAKNLHACPPPTGGALIRRNTWSGGSF